MNSGVERAVHFLSSCCLSLSEAPYRASRPVCLADKTRRTPEDENPSQKPIFVEPAKYQKLSWLERSPAKREEGKELPVMETESVGIANPSKGDADSTPQVVFNEVPIQQKS